LQAVAHVGSLERNNVHVEGSELETELHNDFFTPNSRPLALLCVGDRAAIKKLEKRKRAGTFSQHRTFKKIKKKYQPGQPLIFYK
jgi:hypothetical protein